MMQTDECFGYPFNAADLRAVCADYAEQFMTSIEAVPLDFEPSEGHREAIRRMIDDSLRKGKRQAFLRRLGTIAAVLVLLFGTIMVTNADARDLVHRWVTQLFQDHVMFWFNPDPTSRFYTWQLNWTPEGFTLADAYESKDLRRYEYRSGEDRFQVSIERIREGIDFEDGSTYPRTESIEVGGVEGMFCYNADGSLDKLVWPDGNGDVVIEIEGSIPGETMLEILDDMILEDVRFTIGWLPKGFTMTDHSEGYEFAWRTYERGSRQITVRFEKTEPSDRTEFPGFSDCVVTDLTIAGQEALLCQEVGGDNVILRLFHQAEGCTIEVEANIGAESAKKVAESIHLGLYRYTIGWVPEGFVLTEFSDIDEGDVYYTYSNGKYGFLIDFIEMDSIDYLDLFTVEGEQTVTDIVINGYDAVIYGDNKGFDVVIFDTDHRIIICITTNVNLEDSLAVARSITIE